MRKSQNPSRRRLCLRGDVILIAAEAPSVSGHISDSIFNLEPCSSSLVVPRFLAFDGAEQWGEGPISSSLFRSFLTISGGESLDKMSEDILRGNVFFCFFW